MEKSDLQKFDDDVDRYFKGQMSESEERAFMERVDADIALKERLTAIALMKKAMHDIRMDETEHIAAEIDSMGEDEFRRRAGLKKRRKSLFWRLSWSRYAAAACVIAIIAAAVWLMMRPNPYMALAEEYDYYAYNSDITGPGVRGDAELESFGNDELARLFANVAAGRDLRPTTDALEQALAEAEARDSDLIDPICWNLAFAYLKQGDGEKAKETLTVMLERNRQLYPETEAVVQELIDRIDQIAH